MVWGDDRELHVSVNMERNVSQEAKTAIRQEAKSATRPCYLTHSDLRIRYQWFGLLLGFSYRLDSVRLKRGLHKIQESCTSLAGRIRQDSQGRYCIEVDSGAEIPFTSRDHLKLTLQDVPSTFVRLHIPDCTPDNTLLPIFLEQLHPHLLIAGKEALLQIRLTQLSDGCVLGVSVSHMLADAQAVGQILQDLSLAYHEQEVPCRQESRLRWQQIIAQSVGLLSSTAQPSDDDIMATLPVMEEAPPTFDACVERGAYDLLCLTAQERAVATTCHCLQLLHIPGQCLDRLHRQILQSNAFKEAVPRPEVISKHDITSALVWMIKEAAVGNDLTKGLQNMAMNVTGLRTSGFSELKPDPYIGNALCIVWVQPPEVVKPTMNCASDDMSIRFEETLAAAACAMRLGTQAFRKDVNSSVRQLTARALALPPTLEAWKQAAAKHEQNPFNTCSVVMSSWRNLFDKLDFGEGSPTVIFGGFAPHLLKFAFVTEGPGGDGVLCTLTFLEEDFERLQASRLLHDVAPEAIFVNGCNSPTQ